MMRIVLGDLSVRSDLGDSRSLAVLSCLARELRCTPMILVVLSSANDVAMRLATAGRMDVSSYP